MKQVTGYTQNAWEGSKYNTELGVVEIAKMIRKEIKECIASKKLPKGKYSVTISRYSGGQSLDIKIKEFEFPVLNAECVLFRKSEPNWYNLRHNLGYHSFIATKALEKLQQMINNYRRNDSDSMIDYFDTNFYGNARFDWELERAEEEKILLVQVAS